MSRRKKSGEEEIPLVKVLLLIIILIIFSYVIQGLTYLFELISQYKLVLGILSVIIIAAVVSAYGKDSSNTIQKKSFYGGKNIIDVTPIEIKSDEYKEKTPLQISVNPIDETINNQKKILKIAQVSQDIRKIDTNPQKQISESFLESNVDDFKKLVEILENDRFSFNKKDKNKKEKYYQDELFAQLCQRFDPKLLEYEATNGKHRLDILYNNSIGIELKIYNGKTTKQQLRNQIVDYHAKYDKIIGLVVNPTSENNNVIKHDIEKYISIAKAIKECDYKIIVK